MKLRIFRSFSALLFLGFLGGIYLINPELMSWPLFITAVIVYVVLELVTSFITAKDRSEEDPAKFGE